MKKYKILLLSLLLIPCLTGCTSKPTNEKQVIKVVVEKGGDEFYTYDYKVYVRHTVHEVLTKSYVTISPVTQDNVTTYTVACKDKDAFICSTVDYKVYPVESKDVEVEPYFVAASDLTKVKLTKGDTLYVYCS